MRRGPLACLLLTSALSAVAGQVPDSAKKADIAISHRDRFYTSDQFSNTVSVIDPMDNKLIGGGILVDVFNAADQLHTTIAWGEMHIVGNTITLYQPWALGPSIEATTRDGQPAKWAPSEIGAEVNAHIFRTRHPGLQIGQ